MDPWYKIVTPRKEVREGRSFNPDEFAIALDQVVDGKAPADYQDPEQFFSRTYFTQSLTEHTGTVLRRLSGRTESAAPVLSLITQFGGGKTHTLTSLYHIARAGRGATSLTGVQDLLRETGATVPDEVRVATFVGNAWDPSDGTETPWIDMARQIAGEEGVSALGTNARSAPPGTRVLGNLFAMAESPVLILFDEVLNFINRHGNMADHFYAFIQNLTVAVAGTTHAAAVVSLPRSQVEMTEADREWQERITKVVNRIAQDLIANDESEISEVVRRRLFENLGSPRTRQRVAKAYAEWCFERSNRLPAEWTTVDTATNETRAKEFLQRRFEGLLPVPSGHPVGVSEEMERSSPVPEDQGRPGDAGTVDLVSIQRAVQAGQEQTTDNPGVRPTSRSQLPGNSAGPVGRKKAQYRHRRRPGRAVSPGQAAGRRHQGGAQGHSQAGRHRTALRVIRRDGRQGRPPPGTEVRPG